MKVYKTQEEFDKDIVNGIFKVNDDVKFQFDLVTSANIIANNIKANNIDAGDINANDINARNITADDITADDIKARNIKAYDIKARNIDAYYIEAWNINAKNISYYGVCFAYKNITCSSIKGSKEKSKHFSLDGAITIKYKTKGE